MDLELPLVGLCWDDQRHLILIWPPDLRPITGCWACTIWPHQRHNSSIWLRRYENPIGWTNPARTYYGFGCMLALSFCFVYSSKIIIKIIIIYVYVYWIFFANILVLYCKWQSNCRRLLVHGVLCFKMCAWENCNSRFLAPEFAPVHPLQCIHWCLYPPKWPKHNGHDDEPVDLEQPTFSTQNITKKKHILIYIIYIYFHFTFVIMPCMFCVWICANVWREQTRSWALSRIVQKQIQTQTHLFIYKYVLHKHIIYIIFALYI